METEDSEVSGNIMRHTETYVLQKKLQTVCKKFHEDTCMKRMEEWWKVSTYKRVSDFSRSIKGSSI